MESRSALSDAECQAFEQLPVRVQSFPTGHDILREGEKPSHCCFVIDGWAFRYKLLPEGKRQVFSFHMIGDILNLQNLCIPSMDYAIATLTKTTLGFIPHQAVRELAAQYPNMTAAMWRETLVDAALFRERMVGMGRRSATGNVAHLFCEFYSKQEAAGLASKHRCFLPLTQTDLADALGLSNVHVNRVLQTLRSEGLISWRGGLLIIKEWDNLNKIAGFDPTYLHLGHRTTG